MAAVVDVDDHAHPGVQEVSCSGVLLFQGQGGFHPAAMLALYQRRPKLRAFFDVADTTARSALGIGIFELLGDPNAPGIDGNLLADAEQVGIYLEGVLFAQMALARVAPSAVMGHSFGEFAALAVAGAITFAQGATLVCERVKALRPLRGAGRMLAITAGTDAVAAALRSEAFARLELAVINHEEQSVVSGPTSDLRALKDFLDVRGLSATLLPSRYPFHSSHLEAAVEPFREAARRLSFGAPTIPIYLPVERRLYDASLDIPALLAQHLVTPFDFASAVRQLQADGHREFYECAAGSILRKLVGRTLANELPQLVLDGPDLAALHAPPADFAALHAPPAHKPREPVMREVQEDVGFEPVAVVGYGCALPSALNAEQFWQHVLEGAGGIVGSDMFDPHFDDFFTPDTVAPNRTYSNLMGYIDDAELDDAFARLGLDGQEGYAKVQKIMALALHEALVSYRSRHAQRSWANAVCYFGATPDGIKEYDDVLTFERFASGVLREDPSEEVRAGLAAIAERLGCDPRDVERYRPQTVYRAIVQEVLGAPVKTVMVDTACSSSLYALDMGIKALAAGEGDVAFCAGAFAPGVGNNCLFAQFKGLATSALRAFDKAAEGTVFGDGAAVVIVRRLRDALRDGDAIYGVIRGVGLSSDGKAPAVNVPVVSGQRLAIERAYGSSKVNPRTIQFVEGHATGTTGDAIEFRSLSTAFGPADPGREKIRLGSVKSLIGHTGWASGLASFIKLLRALQARVMPAQYGLENVHPDIDLAESPFTFATRNEPWKPNVSGLPRRAGINSFGFGGTNIHMIVEEFDEAYHRALARVAVPVRPVPALAVIAVNALFPGRDGRAEPAAAAPRFDRSTFALPKGLRLLPDVLDSMSSEQILALMGCADVVNVLKEAGVDLARTGVVISGFSKAERARVANDFIYEQRIRRLIGEMQHSPDILEPLRIACDRYYARNRAEHRTTGPYSLAGVMPNVVSGRVAQMFDLNGPNLVIGEGDGCDAEFLTLATHYLTSHDADVVICGALHLEDVGIGMARQRDEGLVLFCVTTPAFARTKGLEIVGTIDPPAALAANTAA